MPIVGSKLGVREAGWSSNSNREDNSENRSACASGPFDLKRPEQSLELGLREVPQLAQNDDLRHSHMTRRRVAGRELGGQGARLTGRLSAA